MGCIASDGGHDGDLQKNAGASPAWGRNPGGWMKNTADAAFAITQVPVRPDGSTPASGTGACSPVRPGGRPARARCRSEEHTSELQSLMRISYAVFCLNKTIGTQTIEHPMSRTQH